MNDDVLQNKIEFLANKKIRKGFSKFLINTINYLQINIFNINKNDAIEIVKFINSSNSKCSLSYWILRKNMNFEQANVNYKKYSNEFMSVSYKNTNRSDVAKKHLKKFNSRGCSGSFEIDGVSCYCRSSNEFLYYHILSNKYGINNIRYEEYMFNIDNKFNYKPDFFIYKDNILVKLLEVKDKSFIITDKYKLVIEYFNKNNILYEIVTNFDEEVSIELKNKLQNWKNSPNTNRTNVGKLNPRYGAIVTEQTRKKISKKLKELGKNPEYRKKLSNSQKQRYIDDPTLYDKASQRAKIREQNLSKESKIKRAESLAKTNFKKSLLKYDYNIKCKNCDNIINKIKKESEKLCKVCIRKEKKKTTHIKMGKTSIIIFLDKWILDTSLNYVISMLKKQNLNEILLIRKREINKINAKIGIKSIVKYYNTVDNLIKILMENYENK